ncbi:XRE family transcriptional regulator [Streptomyces sp. NPDC091268]|uniref:XRE family transcriptional regulator n=1 Tax=Streptomyces sp. NPDC091268 TaxID=3365979 RepID=UPI00381FB470
MADLSHALEAAMRRRYVSMQALADRTGIRTRTRTRIRIRIRIPSIKVVVQDGAAGPVHPTEPELRELAHAFGFPLAEVLPSAALAGVPSA